MLAECFDCKTEQLIVEIEEHRNVQYRGKKRDRFLPLCERCSIKRAPLWVAGSQKQWMTLSINDQFIGWVYDYPPRACRD